MKAFLMTAAKATAGVFVVCWVISQFFPNLVSSVTSGASPDFTRK